jgi:hypothetical protein
MTFVELIVFGAVFIVAGCLAGVLGLELSSYSPWLKWAPAGLLGFLTAILAVSILAKSFEDFRARSWWDLVARLFNSLLILGLCSGCEWFGILIAPTVRWWVILPTALLGSLFTFARGKTAVKR